MEKIMYESEKSIPGNKAWQKRLAGAAFIFFLLKGLIWLLVSAISAFFIF